MILAKHVKDYLKSVIDCPQWYVGKLVASKEFCIAVYPSRKPPKASPISIGGLDNTIIGKAGFEVLIHWGTAPTDAEEKAQEVYTAFYGQSPEIGGHIVTKIDLGQAQPANLGTDDSGIHEFYVDAVIFYERK